MCHSMQATVGRKGGGVASGRAGRHRIGIIHPQLPVLPMLSSFPLRTPHTRAHANITGWGDTAARDPSSAWATLKQAHRANHQDKPVRTQTVRCTPTASEGGRWMHMKRWHTPGLSLCTYTHLPGYSSCWNHPEAHRRRTEPTFDQSNDERSTWCPCLSVGN